MRITWYGHAAFLIETQGLRIILDPYRSPDSGGYLPINEPADLVIVSHEEDIYHSHVGQIVPPFQLVKALDLPAGGEVIKGIRFETVHVYEHADRKPDEKVTIIHFRSEDMHVVFLGDLGHSLTEAEVAPLRGADVVLIPAGGLPTIDYPDIPPLLEAIQPRLVVPMHFKTRKINLNIKPVIKFLEALPGEQVTRTGSTTIELSRDALPETREIRVLDYAK
jgi:L-ascorbate metabolism protein UlaG (beta-lactamase superfamily)